MDWLPNNKRAALLRMGIIIGLTYGLCLGFMAYNQRSFIYHPGGTSAMIQQWDKGAYGAQILNITPEEGLSVRGWYWPAPDKTKPTIVYFHGNAQAESYWQDKMMRYQNEGLGFVLADYRGYSGNAGTPTEQGLYQDARSYINMLINDKGLAPHQLVLMGESLGGGVAVQMATEFPTIRALILESTYSSIVDVAHQTYWFFPVGLAMIDRFDSLDKIASVRMPVMILHGDQDTLISYNHAERLYNAVQQNKKLIKIEGGTHHDLYQKGAAKYVVGFLKGLDYSNQQ